jgi:hypothetical protein
LHGVLDVRVWEKGNPARQGLRLHQPGALPLRPGDLLHIEARLNRPAYLYVVWLDSQGKATPVYPWQDDWRNRPAGEQPRDRLELPEGGRGAPLDKGPSGVETLLLLARDEPLPAGADVAALFAGLPKQQGPPRLQTAAWFENGAGVRGEADRAPLQLGKAVAIDDPVVQTQALLKGKLREWFSYTRAVCFSFQGE